MLSLNKVRIKLYFQVWAAIEVVSDVCSKPPRLPGSFIEDTVVALSTANSRVGGGQSELLVSSL